VFLRLAVTAMGRHSRRTVLILFSVAISVMVMEAAGGLMEGMRESFLRTLTSDGAHVTLYARGWKERLDQLSLDHTIADPDRLMAGLKADGRVRGVEKVMSFGALLVADRKNIGASGIGVQADTVYYGTIARDLRAGSFPPRGNGIVISGSVARVLGVSLHDPLIVLVQDRQGSPYYLELQVSGIFESSSLDFDTGHFFISHENAEQLLDLPRATTEIRIRLNDPGQAETYASTHRLEFQAIGLEEETWRAANKGALSLLGMFDFFLAFMDVCIIAVAAAVIVNAILMNIFDRIQEFGTLRAIGLKRRGMREMILAEGFFHGFAGASLGLLLGIPLVLYFQQHGMDWGRISDLMGVGNRIFFKFSPLRSLQDLAAGLVISLVSSFYAARVSGRLSIMDSLTYV